MFTTIPVVPLPPKGSKTVPPSGQPAKTHGSIKSIGKVVNKNKTQIIAESVLYNYDTTRKVSLSMMIEHTKSARMGVKKSLLVFDLPYNTYRNKSEALKNSKRAIKETKCDAVKVEGGTRVKEIVKH